MVKLTAETLPIFLEEIQTLNDSVAIFARRWKQKDDSLDLAPREEHRVMLAMERLQKQFERIC